ncbi:MAG: tetraacyldisaccharide 4'-kinase [Cryomorphaceae bacterium]
MNFFLFPFAIIYGIAVRLRNALFDIGIFRSVSFDIPVVVVGNLRVGGTGKTPAIISLSEMLAGKGRVSVLSRGYGRSTNGWHEVSEDSEASKVGDEPLLIKRSNPKLDVVVMENRVEGIKRLLKTNPQPQLVLLDDAMQHRWVRPRYLILLTTYHQRYMQDHLLPMGRLREPRSAASRADTIVVTKCPPDLDPHERRSITKELNPLGHQNVCFAYEDYPGLTSLSTDQRLRWEEIVDKQVLLITAIADTTTLCSHIDNQGIEYNHIAFRDHHVFTDSDMERVRIQYEAMGDESAVILTTEKDAQRIVKWMQNQKFADLPILAIRHRMQWFEKDRETIEKRLNGIILQNPGDHTIH